MGYYISQQDEDRKKDIDRRFNEHCEKMDYDQKEFLVMIMSNIGKWMALKTVVKALVNCK